MSSDERSPAAHIAIGVALLVFGFLALFSIGFAVITVGAAHLAMLPVRNRPAVYWPVMLGLIAFWVAFAMLAPMRCTTAVSDTGAESWCSSLAGIRYTPEASVVPGLLGAAAVGVIAVLSSRALLRRHDETAR